MKKMMFTLVAMLTIAIQTNAMSYEQARNEALFLTDKMAYELNLTDAQYEACYEINLDYLMGVTSRYDVYGPYWERRNLDLSYILYSWQWEALRAASYFYRPLYWDAGYWHFGIYARYPHRDYFYFGRPHFYASYRGGHSWRMNSGRSFYQHRAERYRPNVGYSRDRHVGMRNGWERGDYRNGVRNGSSTRYTPNNRNQRNNRSMNYDNNARNSNRNDGVYNSGSSRSNSAGGFGSTRRSSNTVESSVDRRSMPSRSNTVPSRSSSVNSNRSGSMNGSRGSVNSSRSSMGGNSMSSRSSSVTTTRSSSSSPVRSNSVGRSGGNRSGGTSNNHGNFGGARR